MSKKSIQQCQIQAANDDGSMKISENEHHQTTVMHLQSKFSPAIAIVNSMEETSMRQMPSRSHMEASGLPGRSGSCSPKGDVSELTGKREDREDASPDTNVLAEGYKEIIEHMVESIRRHEGLVETTAQMMVETVPSVAMSDPRQENPVSRSHLRRGSVTKPKSKKHPACPGEGRCKFKSCIHNRGN